MPDRFEDMMAALNAAHRRKVVSSIWKRDWRGPGVIELGVTYEDGSEEAYGTINLADYPTVQAANDAVISMFARKGVDVTKFAAGFAQEPHSNPDAENARRERIQRLAEALANSAQFGRFMPGSIHYIPHGFEDMIGSAFGGGPRQPDMFRQPAPPPNPERTKALDRCRDLKRLRDSSTFPGEKRNAQDAMDKLQAKHGIKDREI